MQSSDYIVVTFATKDKYLYYAQNFEYNMKELNLEYDIEYIDPIKPDVPNDRLLNDQRQKKDTGRIRGRFLYRKLEEYQRPILYMDVDDGLIGCPKIPVGDYDVGFVKNNSSRRMSIHVALVLLKPQPNTFHFLKVWDYLNAWPELEPIGGSHIRFIHAKNICFRERGKWNVCGFKEADLTKYLLPFWEKDKNKL